MKIILVVICLLLPLAGCKHQMTRTFPGHDPDVVWTAMQAVAAAPDMAARPPDQRWTVRQNDVFVDHEARRVEIRRDQSRVLQRPRAEPLFQKTEWIIRLTMDASDPPTVTFKDRGSHLPTDSMEEAAFFFAELRDVLGPRSLDVEPGRPASTRPVTPEESPRP